MGSVLGRPLRVLLSYNSPLFFDIPVLSGNRYRKGKGIKFWIERLIINSAEELGFKGAQFHSKIIMLTFQSILMSLQIHIFYLSYDEIVKKCIYLICLLFFT